MCLSHGGAELRVLLRTRRAADYAARMPIKAPPDTSRQVRSPMPGLIVRVAVAPGDEVKLGQELCVLEAMKMENVLRAERDGVVAEVRMEPRDTVAADQVLADLRLTRATSGRVRINLLSRRRTEITTKSNRRPSAARSIILCSAQSAVTSTS